MTYHYYGMFQKELGTLVYINGIVFRDKPITTEEDYRNIIKDITRGSNDTFILCSLNIISH